MKLLFICGTLEKGKDGVGDYTIRLAKEIIDYGHSVHIISIYDKFSHGITSDQINQISISRISKNSANEELNTFLRKKTLEFKPDWISIQYVSFGFHNKGFPIAIHRILTTNFKCQKVHIMFHELWIGSLGNVNMINKILGTVQKLIIRRFLKKINPDIITTTTDVYQKKLLPFSVKNLPLFGNIPVSFTTTNNKRNQIDFNIVVFGNITTLHSDLIQQVLWLKNLSTKLKKNILIHFVGNIYNLNNHILDQLKVIVGENNIIYAGYLHQDELSKYLSHMSFALSRADAFLFNKSGTTVALLEHGLPVLLRGNRPSDFRPCFFEDYAHQLYFPSDDIPDSIPVFQPHSNIQKITRKFLELLSEKMK